MCPPRGSPHRRYQRPPREQGSLSMFSLVHLLFYAADVCAGLHLNGGQVTGQLSKIAGNYDFEVVILTLRIVHPGTMLLYPAITSERFELFYASQDGRIIEFQVPCRK